VNTIHSVCTACADGLLGKGWGENEAFSGLLQAEADKFGTVVGELDGPGLGSICSLCGIDTEKGQAKRIGFESPLPPAEEAEAYTPGEVRAALNRAADLIREGLDSEVDRLAWNAVGVMVSAVDELLRTPGATFEDIFVITEEGEEGEQKPEIDTSVLVRKVLGY
jgi:hypothetical protein